MGAYSGRIDLLRKSDSSGSPVSVQWKYTIFKSPKHREENSKENNEADKDRYEITTDQRKYSESMANASSQSQFVKEEKADVELRNDEEDLSKDSETKVISSKSSEKFELLDESKNNEG